MSEKSFRPLITLIFNLLFCVLGSLFIKCYLYRFCVELRVSSVSKPIVKRSSSSSFISFYLQFKELTYGLQKTNASTLLRSCLEYVMNHYSCFLPGEGGYLLDLLQDVSFFITNKLLFHSQFLLLLCFVVFIYFGHKF